MQQIKEHTKGWNLSRTILAGLNSVKGFKLQFSSRLKVRGTWNTSTDSYLQEISP